MSDTLNDNYMDVLRTIVLVGGKVLTSMQGKVTNQPKRSDLPPEKVQSSSTAHSEVDDLVQELALEILRSHLPTIQTNVEEDTPRTSMFGQNKSKYTFHLDPLDGTLAYLQGSDSYCIGAGLSKGVDFFASAIYLPARDELYMAERGKGTTMMNSLGVEQTFERRTNPAKKFVQKRCDNYLPVLEKIGLVPFQSMSAHYSMLAVAKGEVQVQLYHMASPHDFGIPQTLVEEAGGVCTNEQGQPVVFNKDFSRQPFFFAFHSEEVKDRFFDALRNT